MNKKDIGRRDSDRTLLIFATKEGGKYNVVDFGGRDKNKEMFEEVKKNRYIQIKTGDSDPPKTPVAWISLAEIEDDWDFILADYYTKRKEVRRKP